MTEPRHLHVVDTATGESSPQCSRCLALLESLDRQQSTIQRQRDTIDELRDEKKKTLATTDLAGDIIDVLEAHRKFLRGGKGGIKRGGPAFKAIKDRLEETDAVTGYPMFTKRHLVGAVVGLWLADREDGWYRRNGKIGAAFLFASADRVEGFIDVARDFRRTWGVSALEVVGELEGPGLAWLADRCRCGRLRAAHLAGLTDCVFDEFQASVERFMVERERIRAA
jgi:hypothetical protein